MMKRYGLILGIAAFFILISIAMSFSQEPAITGPQISETQTEPETLWLWGEVVSIDTQKNELLVKYFDYDSNQEKDIVIGVDDKATFENVKAFAEIKPQDTLSIDYIVTAESRNIAKNISVEKPETEPVPVQENTPELAPEVTPEELEPATTPPG